MREKVVTNKLVSQHAYTRGLSTETALSEAIDFIESSFYRKKKTIAVSLDCSGAFDWVSYDSMKEALVDHNTPENIINWYNNLLSNRKLMVNLQGITKQISPGRGCPQGGILSPLAWNLVMNSLLTTFSTGPIKAVGYADDILLMCSGHDPHTLTNLIQGGINHTLKWGRKKGLTFNPNKTQVVVFDSNRKNPESFPKLHMDETVLNYKNTMIT